MSPAGGGSGHRQIWCVTDSRLPAVVRAAQEMEKPGLEVTPCSQRAGDQSNGLGPVLILYLAHPLGDLIKGLVPADLCPFPLPLLPAPLQRVAKAIRVIHPLLGATQSQTTWNCGERAASRIRGVVLELDQVSLLHVCHHPAATMTELAHRSFHFLGHQL